MITKSSLSRRKLFEKASAAILLYPLIAALEENEVFGQTADAPCALFFYYGSGSYGDKYWPGGSASGLTSFPVMTSPLEAHKESLTFFRGLSHKNGENHYGGPKEVLAGGGDTLYSLDWMLADTFNCKSFVVGTHSTVDGTHPISFKKGGTPLNAQDNPKLAYDDMFGGFTASAAFAGNNGLALANTQIITGKRRMLDFVKDDLNSLQGKLGATEKVAFQRHVDALDTLYKDVKAIEDNAKAQQMGTTTPGPTTPTTGNPTGNTMIQCNIGTVSQSMPTGTASGWFRDPAVNAKINEFNRRLMIQAISCKRTRVAVMQYGHSECQQIVNFDGFTSNASMHGISHSNDASQENLHKGIMTQVAMTIADLKKIAVGNKTLFDNTLILTSTCMGDRPNEHLGAGIPTFIAGTLGGKFKGNRILSFPYDSGSSASGIPYNQVLVSFAQAMGLNVQQVGGSAATGGVPGV